MLWTLQFTALKPEFFKFFFFENSKEIERIVYQNLLKNKHFFLKKIESTSIKL